jgi:Flp pilus assembly pilin Flp
MLNLVTFIQARLAVLKDEEGATATEYALLVTFVAIALIAGMTLFATYVNGKFDAISW